MTTMTDEQKLLLDSIKEAMKVRDTETVAIIRKVQDDVERYGKSQEGTKDAIADISKKGAELHGRIFDIEQAIATLKDGGAPGARHVEKSLGDQFAESDQWKGFVAKGSTIKTTSEQYKVKTITSITGSGGAGIWSDRLPGVIEEPLRPLSIRDLLDVGRTSSNNIEWIREKLFTNNADVVSEGTLKPQSDLQYERANSPITTIAHHLPATKQVLADFPQLISLINGRLRQGLKIKEENEILLGDGTGEHLLGIIPQATDYRTSLNRAGDTMIDVIRHAMLQVDLSFYPPSGSVMSPTDWHNLELTKDNENRYLMASPTSRTPAMLWGYPVVGSHAMTRGGFLVGAFRMASTLWDREDAGIYVSTEDRDNFVRNMVTVLVEERVGLTVQRPSAYVYGQFPIGSTT